MNHDPLTLRMQKRLPSGPQAPTLALALCHTREGHRADVLEGSIGAVVASAGATSGGYDAFTPKYPPILGTTRVFTDRAHTLPGASESLVGICSPASDDADVLAGAVGPVVGASILLQQCASLTGSCGKRQRRGSSNRNSWIPIQPSATKSRLLLAFPPLRQAYRIPQ